MNMDHIITPELSALRDAFVARGFDLRFVGGCVRDMVRDVEPKDVDLCTDADPSEQIGIYKEAGFTYFETGILHGTISVRAGKEIYEITSLRTESDHDGRHATVSYTRDWMDDLGRRDLTFNSMAMTFDGELIDPFNGVEDLKNNVVRFVGNPDDRMTEDYLRILRWLRFHGRMAPTAPLDPETVKAALRQAQGLRGISRERVWMEVAKIIAGQSGPSLIDSMFDLEIAPAIDLPLGNVERLHEVHSCTTNPVTLMVAFLHSSEADNEAVVRDMATKWKWSAEERDLGVFLAKTFPQRSDYMRLMAHDGHSKAWVSELARLNGNVLLSEEILTADVPVFPVKGQDLLDRGFKPGPDMGATLKRLKVAWADKLFAPSKDELLEMI